MSLKKDGYRVRMDSRIKPLVQMISSLPGITTHTSCGGHEKITDFSQCAKDEYLVGFTIDPDDFGLNSLGIITTAANEIKVGSAIVRTCIPIRLPIGFKLVYMPFFQVIGADGADPDELARIIKIHLDVFNNILSPPAK